MLTGHPPWHEFEGVAAIFKIATTYPPIYELPLNTSEIVKKLFKRVFQTKPGRATDCRGTSQSQTRLLQRFHIILCIVYI